jgi:hypothetical protein
LGHRPTTRVPPWLAFVSGQLAEKGRPLALAWMTLVRLSQAETMTQVVEHVRFVEMQQQFPQNGLVGILLAGGYMTAMGKTIWIDAALLAFIDLGGPTSGNHEASATRRLGGRMVTSPLMQRCSIVEQSRRIGLHTASRHPDRTW